VLVYYAFKHAKEASAETRRLLESMADAVDMRDPYVGGHSRRVADLTRAVLREMGKQGPEVELIVTAGRIHDIGKIGIPDAVLQKPCALTVEEQALMSTHPERGADLMARYPEFKHGADIIRHHHESWDGAGYPHRLKGTHIPFGARVIAVVDAYDAMTTDRPYRRGMSREAAAMVLREGRGRQWDPTVVDAFLRVLKIDLDRPIVPALHVVPDIEHRENTSA
jgi:HD-GYP domain-containing protein (c-di-GMP phosphodiesterase class II)